jgi:hypothetical protein
LHALTTGLHPPDRLQEDDALRAACAEGDVLLQEAEVRLAAAHTAAMGSQEQALQVSRR